MHMHHVPRTATFVQVVDILGDEQHVEGRLRQSGQRLMRRVRCGVQRIGPPRVVEIMDQTGVAGETLRRRHLAQVVFRPEPVLVAKGAEPAFGRHSSPGQYDDPTHCARPPPMPLDPA
jgi:hypothetical protein